MFETVHKFFLKFEVTWSSLRKKHPEYLVIEHSALKDDGSKDWIVKREVRPFRAVKCFNSYFVLASWSVPRLRSDRINHSALPLARREINALMWTILRSRSFLERANWQGTAPRVFSAMRENGKRSFSFYLWGHLLRTK